MDSDWGLFLLSAAGLILYLVVSALTEMGTKLPWRKPQSEHEPPTDSKPGQAKRD